MARENKQKRNEKRFGKPERLSDMFGNIPWACSALAGSDFSDYQYVAEARKTTRSSIAAKIIDASNVLEYTISLDGVNTFGFVENIVNAIPPFDMCFMEFNVPPGLSPQVKHAGWAIASYTKGFEPQIVYDAMAKIPSPELYDRANLIVVGVLTLAMHPMPGIPDLGVMCPVAHAIAMLDAKGNALQPPILEIPEGLLSDWADSAKWWAHYTFFDCMLAFCFINCKNVLLALIDPDPALNRERQRADLKPFLRYHTINIEPMKRVLKTEGNIETEGLKRALHICRGCFRTYSEERPLFGRIAGTFWIPAHVRGSHKQGVVISDYKVNAPKTS